MFKPAVSLDISKQQSNASVNNTINITNGEVVQPLEPTDSEYKVMYQEACREVEALKLILKIDKSNPFIVNDFIVASTDDLTALVCLLTNADSVEISADDYATGCLTKNSYKKVVTIYVTKDGETQNFKYGYGNANRILNEEKISTRYVF